MNTLISLATAPEWGFLRFAVLCGILLSPALGVVGTMVVTRRISSLAGASTHAALGGFGLALFLQRVCGAEWFTPTCGAVAGALGAALAVGLVTIYAKEREDTVIGAVWAMQRKGIDYRRKSFFVAQDIDIRCVWMAYIQLSLYGIPAVVIHGNTLTMETWSQWYTPCAAVPFMDTEQESSNIHRFDGEKGEAQCECESKLPVTAKESCSNRQTT